jgi:hypothetical protein
VTELHWEPTARQARHALLVTLVFAAVPSQNAGAQGGPRVATDKGPMGWDVYRGLARLGELPEGVETLQFSSFDRTGENDDGFSRRFSCLRKTADGCVLAEAAGPGEIGLIALAGLAERNSIGELGDLTVELDGKVVLDAPAQDVVDGKLGAPFVFPLVANTFQSSGETYILVPMPYRESMRVTTENRASFYHIVYRRFADARGVKTFDPSNEARDVIALLRRAGERDPKPPARGAKTEARSFELAPGGSARLASLTGPGTISELALRLPGIVGVQEGPLIADDGRAFGKGGFSEFTVRIDPDNEGVRLTRRSATDVGHQRAAIHVGGRQVGEWEPFQATTRWLDQSVELPPSATAGRSTVTIQNEFISADRDFNEFIYWADSHVDGDLVRSDTVDVGPQSTDSEKAHDYKIAKQTWQGVWTSRYPPKGDPDAIAASDALLEKLRLRITFDGETTVDSPVGEFFGSGLGAHPVRSLFFAMDTGDDGWYRAWWPMSYRHSAVVELVNGSDRRVEAADARVTWARAPGNAPGLGPGGNLGYFHATSHRGDVVPGRDWIFLEAEGRRGKLVGVSHTMEGRMPSSGRRNYLEGDERFYIDGSRSPQWHGTGTEEFYQGGWYFDQGIFSNPMNGAPAFEADDYGCQYLCDGAYRIMLSDPVPFSSSAKLGIEVGETNNRPAVYGSTAFWYGRRERALTTTDTLDVGDETSERTHGYRAEPAGERAVLTSVFEGDDDDVEVTEDGRATSAAIEFTLAIDPRNRGVVLRRMSDQQEAYQAARVLVDGRAAGVWLQPLGNPHQRWLEDSFQPPPELTANRRRVRIRLVPLENRPAWHAARYDALSRR